MVIKIFKIAAVLMNHDFFPKQPGRPDKYRLPEIAGVRGHIHMHEPVCGKLKKESEISLNCRKQLSHPGTLNHGSHIAQVNSFIQSRLIIIVHHAGDAPVDTPVRPDHQYAHARLLPPSIIPVPHALSSVFRKSAAGIWKKYLRFPLSA